jgi:hypothetical protein
MKINNIFCSLSLVSLDLIKAPQISLNLTNFEKILSNLDQALWFYYKVHSLISRYKLQILAIFVWKKNIFLSTNEI